jgi:DnaJ-class molecular chaperone
MILRIQSKCGHCKGKGVIENPRWQKFWKYVGSEDGLRFSDEDVAMWFKEKGWQIDVLPPEEMQCPTCYGRGIVERTAPFKHIKLFLIHKLHI